MRGVCVLPTNLIQKSKVFSKKTLQRHEWIIKPTRYLPTLQKDSSPLLIQCRIILLNWRTHSVSAEELEKLSVAHQNPARKTPKPRQPVRFEYHSGKKSPEVSRPVEKPFSVLGVSQLASTYLIR